MVDKIKDIKVVCKMMFILKNNCSCIFNKGKKLKIVKYIQVMIINVIVDFFFIKVLYLQGYFIVMSCVIDSKRIIMKEELSEVVEMIELIVKSI